MPAGTFGLVFDVNSVKFDRAMLDFVGKLGMDAVEVVATQTRLLLQQLLRFTAPHSFAQGRAAVARDIKRAMTPLDDAAFNSKKIAKLIRENNVPAMRVIVQRVQKWKGWDVREFDPVALHQNQRDGRGRIQRSRKIFVLKKRLWKSYVADRQANVGSARAGYWPGYSALGGTVAQWVSRHGGTYGDADLSRSRDGRHPQIRITNRSRAAVGLNQENHNLESAMRVRANAMTRDVERRIRERALEAGLTVH